MIKALIVNSIKSILNILGIHLTRNQKYDAAAKRIYQSVLKKESNCVDIGCHKGEILDQFLKMAPLGIHYAFEPIPEMFTNLKIKYRGNDHVKLYDCALSDHNGRTGFQYVKNAPAYSGLRQRRYDVKEPEIFPIEVELKQLDDVIPPDHNVKLIKIDVEGAEYEVLRGAVNTIRRCRPLIIFEFGLGASDYYNVKPEDIFSLMHDDLAMNIFTMKAWLDNGDCLTQKVLEELYSSGEEYYFVASPF